MVAAGIGGDIAADGAAAFRGQAQRETAAVVVGGVLRLGSVTPASTVMVMPLSSSRRMRFMRGRRSSTSPCNGIWPPTSPVLPPWGTIAVPVSWQMRQDGGDLRRGRGLQQQRAVALILAAPFFQMRRDFGGVFGETFCADRILQPGEYSTLADLIWRAAARRSRSLIASPRPVSGMGETAIARRALVQFAQHGEQIGGGFPQIAARAEIQLGARRIAEAQQHFAGLDLAARSAAGAARGA